MESDARTDPSGEDAAGSNVEPRVTGVQPDRAYDPTETVTIGDAEVPFRFMEHAVYRSLWKGSLALRTDAEHREVAILVSNLLAAISEEPAHYEHVAWQQEAARSARSPQEADRG